MLPVVKGPVVTARAIKTYGWITVLLSGLGVFALPSGGAFYGVMLLPYNGRCREAALRHRRRHLKAKQTRPNR